MAEREKRRVIRTACPAHCGIDACGSRVIFGSQFPYGYIGRSLGSGSDAADIVMVWGSNPAESAPLIRMRSLMDAKKDGSLIVVIDPRFSVTASKADVYLGLKTGTDAALARGSR